jgi:hypothetical protein
MEHRERAQADAVKRAGGRAFRWLAAEAAPAFVAASEKDFFGEIPAGDMAVLGAAALVIAVMSAKNVADFAREGLILRRMKAYPWEEIAEPKSLNRLAQRDVDEMWAERKETEEAWEERDGETLGWGGSWGEIRRG